MNTKRNPHGDTASGSNRKPSSASSAGRAGTRANRTEMARDRIPVTVSTLRSRLGPTIRSALSSAVETLLGEIVVVMSETEEQLLSKERENEQLKVRLDSSERELKTLQDCLCSAQKMIDQLQGPFSTGHPATTPAQHGYSNPGQSAGTAYPGGGGPELSGALGDAIHGFESRETFKSCHLSIQADGTVTNSYYDPMSGHSGGLCHQVNRTGEMSDRRLSHTTSHPSFGVKEEQGLNSGQNRGDPNPSGQSDQVYTHIIGEECHAPKPCPPSPHNSPSSPSRRPPGVRRSPGSAPATSSDPSPGRRCPASELVGEVAGERPHLCLECGKTFRLLSSLKKHLRIHTGEKPYPCSVCGRRFRESGALKTHLRIHTGEKPYVCGECGARFRHRDGLCKHGRTHTGEKPYGCGVCGKRLSRLQHLKHHQRIHTGERPARCPLCQRAFSDAAGLRRHLLSVHQGERGADGAPDGPTAAGPAEDNDEDVQGPVEDEEEMRFGMWTEEERREAEAAVDCV